MRNLSLLFSVVFTALFTAALALADDSGSQQPPQPMPQAPGALLQGDWTTSLRQDGPRSEISLEMSFYEDRVQLKAICEFDQYIHLEAVTQVPVHYSRNNVFVEQRGYSQSRQGNFYCESSIDPQVMSYYVEREAGDIIRLYFANRNQPIYLFKK